MKVRRRLSATDSSLSLSGNCYACSSRQRSGDQMSHADNLRLLADKAFPELQEEAREKLSLDLFREMTNQHVGFVVRQQRPKTLDDTVAHTLEMELYLKGKSALKTKLR